VPDVLITLGCDPASDSWGFVGVVKVGELEAYRTLEAFPSPADALTATQEIVAGVLGELLAGAEWRRVRESKGGPPTRRDLALGIFDPRPDTQPEDTH
jgi:hypothetical protein